MRDQPRIERHRNDVVGSEFRPRAVGGRDFVRHVLARQLGERARGGDLHLHVDGGGAHVERAAEDVGEAEHVVDLVRVVGASRRHDGVVANFGDFLGRYFRIGIGHREDDRLRRHRLDHRRREGALDGKPEGHVGAFEGLGERALRRLDGVGRLPLVHAVLAALIDHALGVAEDQVLRPEADRLEQFEAGDAGGARAVADELGRGDFAAGEIERIQQAGGGDDGGAVLVVMENRDVEQFAQALLDDETLRRLDVLEVDAAPAGAEIADAIDELVGVLGGDLEIDGVDVGEALEQHGLAFHHRLGRQRAAIAEAEDRRAVGDDGDEIALHRVVVGPARILGDRQHRHRDARRIGERKVALGRHRLGGDDLQLARAANAVKLQGFLVGEGRPAAACGGLGGHYYSMNATGMPGPRNVSGCNRHKGRGRNCTQRYCCMKPRPRVNRCLPRTIAMIGWL